MAFVGLIALSNQPVLAADETSDSGIDPGSVAIPSIAFVEAAEDKKLYNKYFFFHRKGISFEEALIDVIECDAFGRALPFRLEPTRYIVISNNIAIAGVGTVVANLVDPIGQRWADKMFGVPWRRTTRRNNLRVCMGYKGYQRYGLSREIWQKFNFDEADKPPAEGDRKRMLIQQARIASGADPMQPELK